MQDARFMRAALTLGRRGLGRVWPNPAVGCVIVRDGIVVGRGRTADGGRPHAETVALSQAGARAKGATAFVTLEPCAHHGQTPPCAQSLIDAGVSRVVVATQDPDPRVAGRGIAMLRDAGISVETGVLAAEAEDLQQGFLRRITEGMPLLTLKLATSIDGRIATATGDSQWITGPAARRMVHAMRANHDAVMVGAGTARDDDPSLNVRGIGDVSQPVRIVVSSDLNIPKDGYLARTVQDQPLWLCHLEGADVTAWQALGAKTIACKGAQGRVDLGDMMHQLGALGLTRVFCEGGGALAAELLPLATELVSFTGGRVIGADARAAIELTGIASLGDAPTFTLHSTQAVGGDVMQRWRPAD